MTKAYNTKRIHGSYGGQNSYAEMVPDTTSRTRELYPSGFEGLARKLELSSYESSQYSARLKKPVYLRQNQNYLWN